jgi:hypothetical protein
MDPVRLRTLIRPSPCRARTCSAGSSPGWSISSGRRHRCVLKDKYGKVLTTPENELGEHYRIGSGADEERKISGGPQSGALDGRGSGGMLVDPGLKQGGRRAGLSWGRRRRSARLTSSVTPTSGNPGRERARLLQHEGNTRSRAGSPSKPRWPEIIHAIICLPDV